MAKRWYYKDENGNKVPVPQYKINADDYYTKTMSDSRYYEKSATDTLLDSKVSKSDIVQSTGTSTTAVMSQKAVSDISDELEQEVGSNQYSKVYNNPTDFSGLIIDDNHIVVSSNSVYNSFIIRIAKGATFSFNRIISVYKLSDYPKLGDTIQSSDCDIIYLANKEYTTTDTTYLILQGPISTLQDVIITIKAYGLKGDVTQLQSVVNGTGGNIVRYIPQELSTIQKSIARDNIGAAEYRYISVEISTEQTITLEGNYKKTALEKVIIKDSIITDIEGIPSFYPYNSQEELNTSTLITKNILPYTVTEDWYGCASSVSGNLTLKYRSIEKKEKVDILEEKVNNTISDLLFSNKKIAVFGDSITHMTGLDGKSYSDWIAEYTGAEVVNFGIGGATIRQRSTPSLDPASAEQEQPPRNVFDVAFSSLDVVNMVKAFVTGDTSYQEAAKQWAIDNPNEEGAETIVAQIDSIDRLIASDIKDFDAVIIMAGTNDFWNTGTTFIDEQAGNLKYTGEAIKEIVKEIKSYSNKEIAIYWFTPIVRFCDPYPFDIYTNYQEGDRVTYNNKRYEFNIEHPAGTWIGTDVTEITVEESHDIKGWGSNFKNRNKITLEEFSNRLFNLVKSQNIDICDMYHDLGWTFWNFKRFCGPTDRTHPYYGLQYIGRKISSWIISHKTVL